VATLTAAPVNRVLAGNPSSQGALQTLAFSLYSVYLFLAFSKIHEFVSDELRVMVVLGPVLLLLAILGGGVPKLLGSRPGILLIAFTVWLGFASPFGLWPGGSVEVLRVMWLPALVMFVVSGTLISTPSQCRRAMYIIAFAGMCTIVLTFLFGSTVMGRLTFNRGTLSNPNDLSNHVLFCFPFCLLVIRNEARASVRKVLAAATIVLILVIVMKTGSRSGLLTAVLVGLLLFWKADIYNKIKISMVAAALVMIATATMSQSVLVRYRTLWSEEHTEQKDELVVGQVAALQSKDSRLDLLWQSLKITARNPFLGVGPGQFRIANNQDHEIRGLRVPWLVSHNAFTQVSSEAGLPALAFYSAALYYCIKTTSSIYKRAKGRPELKQVANMADCLRLSFFAFLCSAMFTSMAYQYYFPLLAGLSFALAQCAHPALAQTEAKFSSRGLPPASYLRRPTGAALAPVR